MHTVKINNKEKSTSIRISERTKRMLDAMSVGKETHEKIILRLIKQGNTSTNTQIIIKKNVVGTKYNRLNRMLNIETDNGQFAVVFTYNDFKPLQDNKLDWEVDLELINIKKNNGKWEEPKKEELFYFVILKYLLEYTFSMQLYEISIKEDYFNLNNWEDAYKRTHMSMASFYSDVERRLK